MGLERCQRCGLKYIRKLTLSLLIFLGQNRLIFKFLNSFQENYKSKKTNFDATKKRKKEERDADGILDPEELAEMLNDLPQEQDRIQFSTYCTALILEYAISNNHWLLVETI